MRRRTFPGLVDSDGRTDGSIFGRSTTEVNVKRRPQVTNFFAKRQFPFTDRPATERGFNLTNNAPTNVAAVAAAALAVAAAAVCVDLYIIWVT